MNSFSSRDSRHSSVLLEEILALFSSLKLESFVDGTVGLGGHSAALLDAHTEIRSFIGIDRDPMALALAAERLVPWNVVTLVKGNFSDLNQWVESADGILLDLGVSSPQLDIAERGFSFMKDGPLDMRMGDEGETAADIVNFWEESELKKLFRRYGEEPQAGRAAKLITSNRPFTTTLELSDLLRPLGREGHRHHATRIFQALRIAVNGELQALEKALPIALRLLRPRGRLAVISFHSLEDRIVKNFFRDEASDKVSSSGIGGLFLDKEPTVKLLTRKPITATAAECDENPRSRSAKLRAVEKL